MKKTFLRLLCIASSCVMAQEADTLGVSSAPTQRYEVGDGVTYVYKKPRLIHLVDKLPRNIGKSASSMVSRKYYPYRLGALGATLAILPADPWLIRESRNLGEAIGFSEAHT